MTNGELFIVENPNIEFKLNGSCVWIYLDGVNHYTMPISWWEQEIILFDKIRADIQKLRGCSCSCSDGIIDDVEDILDKYKAEREDKE